MSGLLQCGHSMPTECQLGTAHIVGALESSRDFNSTLFVMHVYVYIYIFIYMYYSTYSLKFLLLLRYILLKQNIIELCVFII